MDLGHLSHLFAGYLLVHALWRLAGRRSPWPGRFLGAAARASGLRVRVEGTPLRRHALLLANHVSWLDVLVLGGASGARFVAKAEIEGWAGIGWLAGLNRTVYVARAERGRVVVTAEQR